MGQAYDFLTNPPDPTLLILIKRLNYHRNQPLTENIVRVLAYGRLRLIFNHSSDFIVWIWLWEIVVSENIVVLIFLGLVFF